MAVDHDTTGPVRTDAEGERFTWPALMPDVARNAVLTVFHAQGLIENLTPNGFRSKPWREGEVRAVLPLIEAALADADLTAEEVIEGIRLGWYGLWTLGRSAMVTEFILSPRCRALHVFAAGGDLGEIRELIPALERFADLTGCNIMGATGRKGWTRVLKPYGYAPSKLTTVERSRP